MRAREESYIDGWADWHRTQRENTRLRKQFEEELAAPQLVEPSSGIRDAHAAYWDGYLHGRERLLARLKQAMEGQ